MGSKLSLSPRHRAAADFLPIKMDRINKDNHVSVMSSVTAAAADWLSDFSPPPPPCSLPPRRSTQIKTYSWDNAQVVLAGNKCDMEEERVVSVDSGRLLAEQLGKSSRDSPSSGVYPEEVQNFTHEVSIQSDFS